MLLITAASSILALNLSSARITQETVYDSVRSRDIPVRISFPASERKCTLRHKCAVALIAPGGGLGPDDYRFVAEIFNNFGYLAIGIQSVLPGDPSDGVSGNIIADRSPGWQRGVDDLHAVRRELSRKYPQYEWKKSLTLVGHSNGGDYSSMALQQQPGFAQTLITLDNRLTLDNRRFPLPRSKSIRVLSIRGVIFRPMRAYCRLG